MDSCVLILNWPKFCILFLFYISSNANTEQCNKQENAVTLELRLTLQSLELLRKKYMLVFSFKIKNTSYSKYT